MGAGIAIVAARGACPTVLYDIDHSRLDRAVKEIRSFFARSVEKGRLTNQAMEDALGRLTPTSDPERLSGVQLVIEAVYEDLAVKTELLRSLHEICDRSAIFASNTSTLSITELAAASGRPTQVVGMHFCLPAPLMKLVEMSPGLETDPAVFSRVWEFTVAVGQLPAKTKDRPGFVLNHFLVPFNNDAIRLVESGVAEPSEVDQAITSALGYPMGPFRLLDLIGLDTQVLLSQALYDVTCDPRSACPPLLRRMVAAGHLGRKANRGFYTYDGSAMFGA